MSEDTTKFGTLPSASLSSRKPFSGSIYPPITERTTVLMSSNESFRANSTRINSIGD